MFIYKITANDKVYIGFDTHEEHKMVRFRAHTENPAGDTKLSRTIQAVGAQNLHYEVIERGFTSIVKLALAEIRWIEHYDSYWNGLNSTPGGDGIGRYDLYTMTDPDVAELLQKLSESLTNYNNEVKWADKTEEERKEMTAHLHNEEVYAKKGATLKDTYANRPDLVEHRSVSQKNAWAGYEEAEYKARCSKNRANGAKGAAKMKRPITVTTESGDTITYESRTAFTKATGVWVETLRNRSKRGLYTKGYIINTLKEA